MKLLTYDTGTGPRCGVLQDDHVLDVTALLGAGQTLRDVRALLELGDAPLDRVRNALARTVTAPNVPLANVRLRSVGRRGMTWMTPLCAQRGGLSLMMSAIHLPSGEKRGVSSAAGVWASALTLPVATSTTDTSDVVQSFAFDVRVWLKAIHLPSGDQSKSPSTV